MFKRTFAVFSIWAGLFSFAGEISSFAAPNEDDDRMGCACYYCGSCGLSAKDVFFAMFPGRTVGFSNSGPRTIEIHLLSGRGWRDKDTKKFTRYRKVTVNNGTAPENAELINIKPAIYSAEFGGYKTYIKSMLIKVNSEHGMTYYRIRKPGRDHLNDRIRNLRDNEVRVDVNRAKKNVIDISTFIQNADYVEALAQYHDINEKTYLKRDIGE